jgi:hypothetical protein
MGVVVLRIRRSRAKTGDEGANGAVVGDTMDCWDSMLSTYGLLIMECRERCRSRLYMRCTTSTDRSASKSSTSATWPSHSAQRCSDRVVVKRWCKAAAGNARPGCAEKAGAERRRETLATLATLETVVREKCDGPASPRHLRRLWFAGCPEKRPLVANEPYLSCFGRRFWASRQVIRQRSC